MWDILGRTRQRPAGTVHEMWEEDYPLPRVPFGGGCEKRKLLVEEFRGDCLIEPEFGYLINGHTVPQRALPRSDLSRSGVTMPFFSGVPSLSGYARARFGRAPVRREKAVISLRGLFEFNYYHALLEILAKLPILDRHVSPSTPVVISPALAQQPFFQTLKALPNLRERNWIVQDDFYIAADQIWVCAIIRAARPTLQGLLGLLGDPPTASGNERRIFLTRDRSRGRCLLNFDTLQPILQAHGFEIVDTEQMPVLEQMKLFADSRVVAGIHGAGLTNLLFRAGHAANLLEIYPPHDADPSFYLLSKDLGFGWNHIIGQSPTSKQRHANFQLDPHGLSKQLDQLEATG